MHTGSIPVADLSGGFDLQATLESGQTFLWRRDDGRAYEETDPYGGSAWYYTVVGSRAEGSPAAESGRAGGDPDVVRVRQRDGLLEWEATTDADPLLAERLRLDDDLPAIFTELPDDELLASATDAHLGRADERNQTGEEGVVHDSKPAVGVGRRREEFVVG